jgi:hypothetical protein
MKKKVVILGILILAAGLGLLLAGGYKAAAVDSPHNFENDAVSGDLTPSNNECTQTCHTLHGASGQSLNSLLGNVNLCVYCHRTATPGNTFPMDANNYTAPGVVGIHHQYNVAYTNLGASDPRPYFKYATIESGKIVCSTCHQVHAGDYDPQTTGPSNGVYHGYQKTSVKVGNNVPNKIGTQTMTLSFVASALTRPDITNDYYSYKVKITTAGAVGVAQFQVSYDGGISYMKWSGSAWGSTGGGRLTGANVGLDNNNNVKVTFVGTFVLNDEWKTFYVTYPFLRANLDSGDNTSGAKFCRNCHANRVNTFTDVRGPGDGTKKFSHPVGAALNANAKNYDRGTPLDANGAAQGSGQADTNLSNDLRLDSGGGIQCYTCHNIHYGDSNSLTQDSPMQ